MGVRRRGDSCVFATSTHGVLEARLPLFFWDGAATIGTGMSRCKFMCEYECKCEYRASLHPFITS